MVKEKTKLIQEKWNQFYSIALKERQEGSRKFLFLYTSWILFLVFLSFSFLAEKNPFRLFLPFQVFDLPKQDPRSESTIYVSDGEDKVYPSRRLVYRKGGIQEDIRELVEEIGRPPHLSGDSQVGGEFYGSKLKKLPNLSIALMSIWVREEKKEIILDFQSQEILREMNKFRFAKQFVDGEDEEEMDTDSYYSPPANFMDSKTQEMMETKKGIILRLTLQAIRDTIISNYSNIQRVEFHLDGERNTGRGVLSAFRNEQ